MDFLFKAIKALILKLNTDYINSNVFKGFSNNYPVPANDNFAIMSQLPNIESHCLLPAYNWEELTENENWSQIDEAFFQVDFYGDTAITTSAGFRLALQSAYANTFFEENYPNCVVGIVKPVINLTNTIDRDVYTIRYTVIFSLQFNNILTVETPSFDAVNFTTILADIVPPLAD